MENEIISSAVENREPTTDVGTRTNYTVRILRSFQEVETIRAEWELWQSHPNCDIDHYLLVCRMRTNVRRPHVIVVLEQNEVRAIVVARLEDSQIAPSIGYLRPLRIPVTKLSVLNEGLLGKIDDAVAEIVLRSLQTSLDTGEADTVELYQLHEKCRLLHTALKRVSWFWRDGRPTWSTHWELTLPDQPGGLLRKLSSKHRYWIRRKVRDLEAAFPGKHTYHSFSRGESVESLCSELESVARFTYQRGLNQGFVDDADHRERFGLFSSRGTLRAWTLRIKDTPRAFCVGFVYRDTFYFSETGYTPDLRSHEIGTLIFLHMTDELVREGVAKFNFGFGDAYYKKRFGDQSWREATLQLYARTFRGFLSRCCTGCFAIATTAGRSLLNRARVLDKLKKAWRNRVARIAQQDSDGD